MQNYLWILWVGLSVLFCIPIYALKFVSPRMNVPYYEKSAFSKPIRQSVTTPKIAQTVRVPILLYHYVEYVKDKKDTIRQSLSISPKTFESQIQTFQEASYSAMFIDDFADVLDGKKELPEKPIILTFDDGYGDFYTDVFPILKKYQMKATAYIVSGVLDKLNYMTKAQVKEIAESGLVEIAAHTVSHKNLKFVSEETARFEIQASKVQLETLIGKEVKNFAYPYGGLSDVAEQLVRSAGYRSAVSVIAGELQSENNRYFLSRLRAGSRTGPVLLNWLDEVNK